MELKLSLGHSGKFLVPIFICLILTANTSFLDQRQNNYLLTEHVSICSQCHISPSSDMIMADVINLLQERNTEIMTFRVPYEQLHSSLSLSFGERDRNLYSLM